ncbi:hypothetical protein TWF506_009253 [Arthrobotrys conoides]|uniref:Uncharacterized protein n=1 Tax=Arthrobotrys conoides TaxID=74498 RepID=A0AAN8RR74_9PEZI
MLSDFTLSHPGGFALTKGETEPTAALCYQEFIALAFLDDAFDADIRKPEDLISRQIWGRLERNGGQNNIGSTASGLTLTLGNLKDCTWAEHYMSKTLLIDLQPVFVGIETELITSEIINTSGHSRYQDTRVPQTAINSGLENQERYERFYLLREQQKTAPENEANMEIQDTVVVYG